MSNPIHSDRAFDSQNLLSTVQTHNKALNSGGRSYLVLTGNMLDAVHSIPQGASKLKFKEVAKIVNDMIGSSESEVAKQLNNELVKLAEHTLDKYQGRIFSLKKGSLSIAQQILQVEKDKHAAFFSIPDPVITRSESGKDGVFFYIARAETVPLKLLKRPEHAIVADRFFQALGFETPDTRLIPTSISSVLIDTLEGNEVVSSKRVRHLHPVQMKYLTATAWEDSLLPEKQKAVANQDFARQLGKMILLDVFMGNTDRIAPGSINYGNFMIDSNHNLVLCDNEIHLDDPDVRNSIPTALIDLLTNPDVLNKYLPPLEADAKGLKKRQIAEFEENVRAGILDGAKSLLQLLNNTQAMNKIYSKAGLPPEAKTFQHDDLKKILENLT